jgi:hypothetical protein
MAEFRPCDIRDPGSPRRPTGKYKKPHKKQKKSMIGGLIGSAIAAFIILFTLGFFPRVGDFFADFNANLQSHNDEIVAAILEYFPAALVVVGTCGLLFVIVNKFVQMSNKRRSSKIAAQHAAKQKAARASLLHHLKPNLLHNLLKQR